MRDLLRAHRRAAGAIGIVTIAAVVFVLVWFEPQKLLIEETVNESVPGAVHPSPDAGTARVTSSSQPQRPRVLAEGTFRSLEHQTTGRAAIIESNDGRRFLRFENLETSNGPDLRVYLSEIPASDDWYAYGERFADLGALKGNRGNQNYEIPSDLDLSRFQSAVIWCRRFTVGFGVAGLS